MMASVLLHVLMLQTSVCMSCRVFGSVMTLQEYLDHRAAGEAVPAIGLVTLAVKLFRVRPCQCYLPEHSSVCVHDSRIHASLELRAQWSVDIQTSPGLGFLLTWHAASCGISSTSSALVCSGTVSAF